MKYLFQVLFLFSSFYVPAQTVPASLSAQGTTLKTYALVIGVAKYLNPTIPKLQYAGRDAQIFADFLKSKAGGSVPRENIRVLIDEAATTGAVYDAIYWLKKSCKKGDRVYIYFSGHGDLENITMYNNGFLICYDSPPFNFVSLALSIDYLNDMANTLSRQKEAKVIIITDACHSGKLSENKFKGNFLAASKLRKSKYTEIRITSSSADQLSNENSSWDDGRGVFSYYLVNGLKGAAVPKDAGQVTLADIKNYLANALATDSVLITEGIIQTPHVDGNDSAFVISIIDPTARYEATQVIAKDKIQQRAVFLANFVPADYIPESAEDYFFTLLKKDSLEYLTDSLKLNTLSKAEIIFAILAKLKTNGLSEAGQNKLTKFEKALTSNNELLEQVNGKLAIKFDEIGQVIITKYLEGEAAELEKRRYYNIYNNGYDVYPKMFEVALKLIQPDNLYYTNNLKVKLHYFTGVACRLKIPISTNPKLLIEKAFAEQKKALALEEYAAYIYNELGILYSYKKNNAKAEKYFRIASNRAPSWALPLVNLADLFAEKGKLDSAVLYADSAISLQPDFQDIFNCYGIIYEKKAKLLQAEEAFQHSIKINDRHFIPFERLGYVYMKTTAYAQADSMFKEAALRKDTFHFGVYNNPRFMKMPKPVFVSEIQCSIDSSSISSNDLMGHFTLGYQAYRDVKLAIAENEFKKVIALDKKNPLAYHYLGKTLSEQQRWQEAEIILKMALANHLPYDLYLTYYDSLSKDRTNVSSFDCIDSCFRFGYYDKTEDYLLLAQLYENWHHFSESEIYYRKLIAAEPQNLAGCLSLVNLFEKTGRYNDAENYLIEYNVLKNYSIDGELNQFYKRVTEQFPENAYWHLKAGNFQYAMAKTDPNSFSQDIKSTDPLTGETINKYPQLKLPNPLSPKKYRIVPYGLGSPKTKTAVRLKFTPFTDGISYLRKAILLIQNDETLLATVNDKIGDLYNWQGITDSAVNFYEAAIDLNETDAGIRNKLVETYTSNYDYSKALIQLDTLSNKYELNFEKQLTLANFFIQDSRFAEAEKLLTAAEKINPITNVELINLKGRLAALTQKPKLALENYYQIYNLNKGDKNNLYTIARLHAAAGHTPEAWKWLYLALEAGFNYTYVLKYDPLMQKLHKDDKWHNILSSIKD